MEQGWLFRVWFSVYRAKGCGFGSRRAGGFGFGALVRVYPCVSVEMLCRHAGFRVPLFYKAFFGM